MNKRVAIIGAGPCGLSQLRAFRQAERNGADIPELVCFERQADWGGLWHYTWRTGLDAHGEPVHGSMYRYLWTNGPKESLEFGDYSFEEHFGKPIPSFPPFEVLNNYILGRAEKSDIRRHVRFGTAVRRIAYDAASGRFNLRATDLDTQADYEEAFDHVVVATGHFSVPHVPSFPGIDRFPGRVLHAHDFRDALEFKGKRLLIVGGSYSAEDIALQNLKYGAASITCTYRSGAMGFKWPQGIEEVPLVTRFEGNKAHFKDGSARDVDAVILCTGYQHHFPFMAGRSQAQDPQPVVAAGPLQGGDLDRQPQARLSRHARPVLHVQHVRRPGVVRPRRHAGADRPAAARGDGARLGRVGRARGGAPESDRGHRLPDRLLQGALGGDRLHHRLGRPVRQFQGLGAPQGRGHHDLSRPCPRSRLVDGARRSRPSITPNGGRRLDDSMETFMDAR